MSSSETTHITFRKAVTLFVVPLCLMLLWYIAGQAAVWVWLVFCGFYVILASAFSLANLPHTNEVDRLPRSWKVVYSALGSIVWGGFLVGPYVFVLWLVFSRENPFPR
jgi:hypothetical protein